MQSLFYNMAGAKRNGTATFWACTQMSQHFLLSKYELASTGQ